ncbi:MAG: hypothetical protein HY706_14245 [Candidatus Hydrogenedentes bacterium]|nr:hypothetical protein [Candidatus Hydrogenedentota bacterium]
MFSKWSKSACLVTVVALSALASACLPGDFFQVGPIRVTLSAGDGVFPASLTAEVVVENEFCDLPTEEEWAERVLQIGDVDLRWFSRLVALDLVEIKLTATSGDFSDITDVSVTFVPAPGSEGEPVILGTASNPNGFTTDVHLMPIDGVDLLPLVRENDANESGECPRLRYRITYSTLLNAEVEFDVDVTVDAIAEIGRH